MRYWDCLTLGDTGEQWKRAIVEFHSHALEGVHGWRDLKQLQDYRLVGSQHGTTRYSEQKAVADLAGSTAYSNADRIIHEQRIHEQRIHGHPH